MSSKSSQGHYVKSGFSNKMLVIAVLMAIVFLTIIVVYPRIFNPSNIGRSTGPAVPVSPTGK